MKPRIRYCILTMYLTTQILSAQVDNTITRSGVKMTLKSKTSIGKNATLAKYCNSKSGKCEELIITSDKKSMTMPFASGPASNIIKSGKTTNYSGWTKKKTLRTSSNQYYNIKGNKYSEIHEIKNGFLVSTFDIIGSNLTTNDILTVFADNSQAPTDPSTKTCDECKKNHEDCYVENSLNKNPNWPGLLEYLNLVCDITHKYCLKSCKSTKKIEITKAQSIIVIRNSITANDFNLAIKN
ncbi:MAG: hypothetical protein IPO86_12540 [Saprospiraceae bacterium]|nr:hypothetical protein [Saprospiraceae bacterium]